MRRISQPKLRYLFSKGSTIDLQPLAIHDPNQVVELVMTGFHGRFPDLAFLLFAIARDAEGLVAFAVQLSSQGNANRDAQSLAKRTGGNFHARKLEPMRTALVGRP